MSRPRVLLADDHRLLREAYARLLEAECDIVGSVADGRAAAELAAAELAAALRPDVVILDIAMPLLNGLDAARQLEQRVPGVKVIILTVNEDPEMAAAALQAGASGFLLKNSAASELLLAIREVTHGRSYVTPLAAQGLLDVLFSPTSPTEGAVNLSPRQLEVLQLLADGNTMKEIAWLLKITPRTVAFHKYSMMEKLGVRSNAELVQVALKRRLTNRGALGARAPRRPGALAPDG